MNKAESVWKWVWKVTTGIWDLNKDYPDDNTPAHRGYGLIDKHPLEIWPKSLKPDNAVCYKYSKHWWNNAENPVKLIEVS